MRDLTHHQEEILSLIRRRGHAVRPLAENPDFGLIAVDLTRQHLAIGGIAVALIHSGIPL